MHLPQTAQLTRVRELTRAHPRCLQDARLLFQLKRQEFIECLRSWEMAGWKQALGAHSLFLWEVA